MKSKRILLIGGNFAPEPTGIGKYNGEMMEWLAAKGHQCSVITTYPYYPYWKVQEPYTKRSFWFKKEKIEKGAASINLYRCPHYVPARPSGLKRMLSDLSFFLSAFVQLFLLLFQRKHDYVIAVVPPFQLGLLALLYKWIRGAKAIYHIQDLQIDTAKELGMIKSPALLRLMFAVERYILKRVDEVSSISDGMIQRIESKCRRPVRFFPNWVATEAFFPIVEKDVLKEEFGFCASDKVVLYSGAIGEKQGLQTVLEAASQINDPRILFVICGSGPYKEQLQKKAAELRLTNLYFLPVQPKEMFNKFLNVADVHLVLQKANADDLVMPSKLTTILSVGGLALVAASETSGLYQVVQKNKMGITIEPESGAALIGGIRIAVASNHSSTRNNARMYAIEFLAIDNVMHRFFGSYVFGETISGPTTSMSASKNGRLKKTVY